MRDDLVDGILITTKDTTTAWTRSGRQEACGPGALPVYQRNIYWKILEKSNNRVLNELLVNLFHNVMDAEAKAVITDEFKDITNNDMHILEAIGIEEPKSMSRIAGELHVTVGTLTTNMNSLEKKGYLERNRSTQDKRVVLVTLTEKGRKAFFHHRDFHRKMIHTIIRDLDEEEMKTLIKCLGKLDTFFREGNEE